MDYKVVDAELTSIADAIRIKGGTSSQLTFPNGFITAVQNIPTGGGGSMQTKTKSYTPTETAQSETVTADSGYDGLSSVAVSVGAVDSNYVGSGITRRSSTDLTTSGATVTVPSGFYSASATKSVASGTEGTPTATKGTVSNHSISVTPKVTNTGGYITGSTKTGTAVTVTATELASGNLPITQNADNINVVGYSSVSVNVQGGIGTLLATKSLGTISTNSTTATDTGKTVSVSGINNYDLLVVETSVDTKTNNRHASTMQCIWLTASSTIGTKNGSAIASATMNDKLSSNGTATSRSNTNKYGIYVNSVTISNGSVTLAMYQRYNSTHTGTINGSYTTRVYGANLYDLIGG